MLCWLGTIEAEMRAARVYRGIERTQTQVLFAAGLVLVMLNRCIDMMAHADDFLQQAKRITCQRAGPPMHHDLGIANDDGQAVAEVVAQIMRQRFMMGGQVINQGDQAGDIDVKNIQTAALQIVGVGEGASQTQKIMLQGLSVRTEDVLEKIATHGLLFQSVVYSNAERGGSGRDEPDRTASSWYGVIYSAITCDI